MTILDHELDIHIPVECGIPGLVLREDVDLLREDLSKHRDPHFIVAQKGGQENALMSNADIMAMGGNRGGGKCLLYTTRVLTPFGYKPIGELKSGDIISGRDGKPQRVLYLKHSGVLPCYNVKFIDGSEIITSADHAWNAKRTCYIPKRRHTRGMGMEHAWEVMTTEMIYDFVQRRARGDIKHGNIVIPVCEPVVFTTKSEYNTPSVDPYVVGALIGDGCLSESLIAKGSVSLTSADREIVEEFEKCGIDMSRMSIDKRSKASEFIIRDRNVLMGIESLGLRGHLADSKFIPDCYKFGTIEERFAIVQGLMDTDGYIDGRGHCEFCTVSKQLAEDMKFIISSLGGLATLSTKKGSYKKDGERIVCKTVFHLYIKMPDATKIFRLPRKVERMRKFNGGVSEFTRRIVSVEPIGDRDCCCIRVSNPDSLFLVEDFIVTHNTYFLLSDNAFNAEFAQHARMLILRAQLDDLSDIIDTSYDVYNEMGDYKKQDNRWDFNNGSWLAFNYHSGGYEEFMGRFRGRQYGTIDIDEGTLISFEKFKFLITCLRNAYGYKNKMRITCNPDPDSWMATMFDWWFDDNGDPIPARDGKIRYAFFDGDTPQTIVWGNTKKEVYEKCRDLIDSMWTKDMAKFGKPEDIFIKSVTFIRAELTDNIALLQTDPTYISNIAGQSEQARARDFLGNWKFKARGDDMISGEDILRMYDNVEKRDDHVRYASCDAAFDGGDNLVMYLWEGWHIQDIAVSRKDSLHTIEFVKAKLRDWRVMERNFTYDLNGVGQTFKGFFPDAIPFNNRESVSEEYLNIYDNIKSQAAYMFAQKVRNREISINNFILHQKFSGSGFSNVELKDIIMKERRAIRANEASADRGFSLIKKADMKKIIGHSPDFIEGMLMRLIFEIRHQHHHATGLYNSQRPRIVFSRRKGRIARRQ